MTDIMSTSSESGAEIFELEVSTPEQLPANLHAPFLERAEPGGNAASEQALAAFVTLRVIDQFGLEQVDGDALTQQLRATLNFLSNVYPPSIEIGHLEQIARAAETAHITGSCHLIWSPLSTFAAWLERQLRLTESLDVLDTSLRAGRRHSDDAAIKAIQLHRGRVLRTLGRHHDATAAYAAAGELGVATGDHQTELLSRIGRGIVLRQLGNLPAAGALFKEVHKDAVAVGDRDAQARALHDLAANYLYQNKPEEAVRCAYQAYGLYEESENKQRALSDLGTALEQMGHYVAAKDAFELVLTRPVPTGMRIRILLELMGLASTVGDRVSFELRRREIDATDAELPPSTQVDYDLKMGVGMAAFGLTGKAGEYLERAVALAEEHSLNEYLFRAEALLEELRSEPTPEEESAGDQLDTAKWEQSHPDIVEVAEALHTMLVGT
jgi:tetratricopeptide (TPR) repeat protein